MIQEFVWLEGSFQMCLLIQEDLWIQSLGESESRDLEWVWVMRCSGAWLETGPMFKSPGWVGVMQIVLHGHFKGIHL